MNLIILANFAFTALSAFASGPLPHEPSKEILQRISEHNLEQAQVDSLLAGRELTNPSTVLPFAEYQQTGYVFFDADDRYGQARKIKEIIAANLPADVTLVVYSTSKSDSQIRDLEKRYRSLMGKADLKVLRMPRSGSNSFWTRDNLPLPVWTDDQFTLVDARYYYNFEPDDFVAALFSTIKTKHRYFFEGGNFIANSLGECIVVNRRRSYPGGVSDTAAIPDDIFKNHYGCNKLVRLRHLKGIGHSDEVVKFMNDNTIVTDTPQYVDRLRSLGYKVVLLPEADLNYETYVNSLQVNDVLFVPTFGEAGDQRAINVYKNLNLGLKVVPIPTKQLATRGQGGIHCITMNYPPAPMDDLVRELDAQVID